MLKNKILFYLQSMVEAIMFLQSLAIYLGRKEGTGFTIKVPQNHIEFLESGCIKLFNRPRGTIRILTVIILI